MNPLLYPIILPFIFGAFCLLIPKRQKLILKTIGLSASGAVFVLAIYLFIHRPLVWNLQEHIVLRMDGLSSFILLAICLFGVLVTMYSFHYMNGKGVDKGYYINILWTISASCGAVLANNFILFLVFWGFLGVTLYLLINIGGQKATSAAKKTFIIIGGSDCLILLGIAIIFHLVGTFQMDKIHILLNSNFLPCLAYLCLAIGAFAKAGAMPMHSWIPDMAQTAPVSVTAFLPASLDKLLGIYLLARISLSLFVLNKSMSLFLLIIGSVTIIAAVMMALIQHDFKRLLGYHAVSQVGYMVLGIGTGIPVGIAGGIFHMLNNAIYKGCLFLCGGSVEHRAKTADLDKLGGLAKIMPITFITCLIAALSISGVPPFNGFVSKWMVYQGIIELGKAHDNLWIIWLVCAMFGSALTLASFMKLIHATFLGQRADNRQQKTEEVHWTMWTPQVLLAGLCILFGIFATQVPLKNFILPAVKNVSFLGFWTPGLATLLIIMGILIGLMIYWLGNLKKTLREDSSFIGGEELSSHARITGVDFYNTIKEIKPFKVIYRKQEQKFFDIYEVAKKFTFFITRKLQLLHNGVLPTYLVWCLLGMAVLFFVLVR